MADGKIVVTVDADAKKAQKELDTLSAKIDKMEAKLNEDTGTQSGLKKELDAALQSAKQTEDALKSLRSEADRLKGITSGNASANPAEYIDAYSRQAEVAAQIKEQEQLLVQQNKTAEKLGSQYAKITDKVITQTDALDAAKTKAGELVQQITNASGASAKMAEVSASVEKSMNKFGRRLSGVLRSALVFTVLSRGLSQLRSWLSETIKKSDEARAAVARLKGALLTLAQPIMKVVIPAFILLVNVLTRIVNALATLVSKLFGTSFPKSAAEAAAAYGDEAEAISDVGDAAKKAGKSMASFDEINQLSNDSGSSGGAGAGGGIGSDTIAPDFSAMIKDQLTSITELFVGAALLALGAILTFSGANIPLGIALMAVGALAVWDAVSNHWGEIAGILQGQVGLITAIVSTALLAIGALLVFSGANIPLGLGLMIAGAVGLAATVAANWGSITEALQGPIGIITAIVSGALLVVGAILAFSGANIPIGIGLMAAGAVGLAAVAAVNWDTITAAAGPCRKYCSDRGCGIACAWRNSRIQRCESAARYRADGCRSGRACSNSNYQLGYDQNKTARADREDHRDCQCGAACGRCDPCIYRRKPSAWNRADGCGRNRTCSNGGCQLEYDSGKNERAAWQNYCNRWRRAPCAWRGSPVHRCRNSARAWTSRSGRRKPGCGYCAELGFYCQQGKRLLGQNQRFLEEEHCACIHRRMVGQSCEKRHERPDCRNREWDQSRAWRFGRPCERGD